MLIRSISGLRGITDTPDGLTDEVINDYVSSYATMLGGSGIVALGFDGRHGGKRIYELASEALRKSGCDVLTLGMVPTPTVMFSAETKNEVIGGISVTASHNPQQWNGLKFINGKGLFFDADENNELWRLVFSKTWHHHLAHGKVIDGSATVAAHIDTVLSIPFLALDAIKDRGFKVVLDAVNASGSFIQQQLLEKLGVSSVIGVATDGTGIFPHTPEPIPENLTFLCDEVRNHHGDIGIAVDPDADRCVLITEKGEPFIEENTIVLAIEEVLSNSAATQSVVVNLSTTRAVEDIAKQYRASVYRTPVGEINVAKKMLETSAIIGGEGSGGVIFPQVHIGRDSLVAVALALSNLARSGMTVSEKKQSLPQYEIVKAKKTLNGLPQAWEEIEAIKTKLLPKATDINDEDGLRMEFGNKWLHVRVSNTEPIMRFIAEAPSRQEAEDIISEVLQ
jgi:phosphomannomutase